MSLDLQFDFLSSHQDKNVVVKKVDSDNEYDVLEPLIDKAFSYNHTNTFFDRLPKIYTKENGSIKNQLALSADGQYRASAGLFYNEMVIAGNQLKICGIGNVFVSEEYRHKGYMKSIMKNAVSELIENDTDMAFLGGNRQRYEYFSFEPCGYKYNIDFLTRNEIHFIGNRENIKLEISPITKNDKYLKEIKKINEARPAFIKRDFSPFYDIIRSWDAKIYKATDSGKLAGYFFERQNGEYVHEIGYTDKKYIPGIVNAALNMSPDGKIEIDCPSYDKNLLGFLSEHCEYLYICPVEQFSVFNYKKTVSSFLNLKSETSFIPDGKFSFEINGIKRKEKFEIISENNKISVIDLDDKQKCDIVLNHTDAMRFFFSIHSEIRDGISDNVKSWLPLPLFIYSTDLV